MSNIDKQAVQAVADLKAGYTLGHADVAILNELARIALASLEANGTLANEGTITATQIKPVADLYEVTVPSGRSTTFTKDAAEASDCRVMGWSVQEYVKLERYQAAMLQGGDGNYPVIPDGYCIMPLKLTADNGAKGALCGEFHVQYRIVCQSCVGEGCEDCNHTGGWDAEIPVSWNTIKRIHDAAVKTCALPAAPQQKV